MAWKGHEQDVRAASCCCLVAKSRSSLCDHMDCDTPGSSVHRISQARILEWVAISFSRISSRLRDPRDQTHISCIGRQILYRWATRWAASRTWEWQGMDGLSPEPPEGTQLYWCLDLSPRKATSDFWPPELYDNKCMLFSCNLLQQQ